MLETARSTVVPSVKIHLQHIYMFALGYHFPRKRLFALLRCVQPPLDFGL